MVHPQEDKNNALQQHRKPREEPQAGRQPFPGELVGRKESPYEVTGVDAIAPLLTKVRFPATKEEVVAQIGHAVVPISKWKTASVAEILDKTTPDSFSSNHEVAQAVNRVWDQIAPPDGRGRGSQHRQDDDVHGAPHRGD